MITTTLCWHCNHAHALDAPHCDECGATNPNLDFDAATAELHGEQAIVPYAERMPMFLRRQAA